MQTNKKNSPFPKKPDSAAPAAMSDEKIKQLIENELPEWHVLKSSLPENPFKDRVELFREFKFKSFVHAIDFMAKVAPGCNILNHHPRWENIWKTLIVYTTTWDIGHRISDRDLQMARFFNNEYDNYEGAARSKEIKDDKLGPTPEFILQLKELVAENKLLKVVEKIQEYNSLNSKVDSVNELFQFKARINKLKKIQINGGTDPKNINLEYNTISQNLLDFIDVELGREVK